jgi:hypothetical protein
MVASTFLLRRTIEVALELREEPNHFVGFEDVLDRDFRAYTGHWSVETDSARTVVRYQLLARPRFPIPHVIGRGMMRSAAQDLLAQVRHEMARRSADPSPRVSEGSGAVAGTPARAATPAGSAPERSASEP